MKVLILLFILTVTNYSKQQPPAELSKIMETEVQECVKTTTANPALIEKAFKEGVFTDDKNFKCFMKCMFVKMGDMTEDGKLNPDKMKTQAPPGVTPAQASAIIDKCKDSTGADPCDVAYNAAKCMVEEAIKLFGSG